MGRLQNTGKKLKQLGIGWFCSVKNRFHTIKNYLPPEEWRILMVASIVSLAGSLLVSWGVTGCYNRSASDKFTGLMRSTADTMVYQITETVEGTTKKSTKEIVEALFPNDFSLVIDETEYSPGCICRIKTKTKEIEPYFAVRNNSKKYPAKDITVAIFLDKNTIKEGMEALEQGFIENGAEKILRMTPFSVASAHFEGKGFVIPSPIYPRKLRDIHSLKLQMIENETRIIVVINKQHSFYIVYRVVPERH